MKDRTGDTSSNKCVNVCTFFTFIIVVTTFGTFSILQWKEIIKLNERITRLEFGRLVTVQKRNQDELTPSENNFNDVYEKLMNEISEKQKDLLRKYCSNSSKICLPGATGPKGEKGSKGDPGHSGGCGSKHRIVQRDLQGLLGTQFNDVADTCCNHLAKPMLTGPAVVVVPANKGGDVILPCKPTGLPPAQITWSPAVDPKHQGRYIQTVDGLLVRSTEFTDSTTFTCQATNIFGTVNKKFNLIVTDPIKINITPSQSQLNANQKEDLTCSFSGVPPPTVKWYHVTYNGLKELITSGVTTGAQQSVLHLDSVGALSAGQYICEVANGFENKSVSSSLNVISKPVIIGGPNNHLVNIGTTLTLYCDNIANPPASVSWNFPKTGSIPPKTARINSDGSVTLFHVDAFSEGDYTCTATNSVGSTTASGRLSINVPFTVTASPHNRPLVSGESFLQLTCDSSGGGQTQFSWSKTNSPPLSGNPGKFLLVGDGLIVTSVDLATDTGVYVCNGTNGNKQGSDKVVLYKDMGQLNCSTTFNDCGVGISGACGGTCPGTCTSGNIYGYFRYTLSSLVCLAGKHAGPVNNNKVIWTVEPTTDTFEAKLSNGIQSKSFGLDIQEAVFWTQQQTGVPSPLG
ncbi:neural cell adhesion molecule L1-like protein [Mytilus edulis]|uniref:neural cell adhesion molecule L1-like protein n=1 Tax=Mytilus edulis TaxID=6550 RepID=UPI0039EEC78A